MSAGRAQPMNEWNSTLKKLRIREVADPLAALPTDEQ